jgi:hypothetical protein
MTAIAQQSKQINGGPHVAASAVFDIDCVTTQGSIALLPRTKQAVSYCELALSGWVSAAGIYFIPNASAELVLRLLTQRYRVRVDGEMVS